MLRTHSPYYVVSVHDAIQCMIISRILVVSLKDVHRSHAYIASYVAVSRDHVRQRFVPTIIFEMIVALNKMAAIPSALDLCGRDHCFRVH
jgi:hypothetical protein